MSQPEQYEIKSGETKDGLTVYGGDAVVTVYSKDSDRAADQRLADSARHKPWRIINQNSGGTIATFATREEAERKCEFLRGTSPDYFYVWHDERPTSLDSARRAPEGAEATIARLTAERDAAEAENEHWCKRTFVDYKAHPPVSWQSRAEAAEARLARLVDAVRPVLDGWACQGNGKRANHLAAVLAEVTDGCGAPEITAKARLARLADAARPVADAWRLPELEMSAAALNTLSTVLAEVDAGREGGK